MMGPIINTPGHVGDVMDLMKKIDEECRLAEIRAKAPPPVIIKVSAPSIVIVQCPDVDIGDVYCDAPSSSRAIFSHLDIEFDPELVTFADILNDFSPHSSCTAALAPKVVVNAHRDMGTYNLGVMFKGRAAAAADITGKGAMVKCDNHTNSAIQAAFGTTVWSLGVMFRYRAASMV